MFSSQAKKKTEQVSQQLEHSTGKTTLIPARLLPTDARFFSYFSVCHQDFLLNIYVPVCASHGHDRFKFCFYYCGSKSQRPEWLVVLICFITFSKRANYFGSLSSLFQTSVLPSLAAEESSWASNIFFVLTRSCVMGLILQAKSFHC